MLAIFPSAAEIKLLFDGLDQFQGSSSRATPPTPPPRQGGRIDLETPGHGLLAASLLIPSSTEAKMSQF